MELSEPGALPCGSWPQAGPKTSALVVTPLSAMADVMGAAAASAAGLDALPAEGVAVPPQAASATVAAAIAPMQASRWIFRTGSSSRLSIRSLRTSHPAFVIRSNLVHNHQVTVKRTLGQPVAPLGIGSAR
jgi:hypothetical protein